MLLPRIRKHFEEVFGDVTCCDLADNTNFCLSMVTKLQVAGTFTLDEPFSITIVSACAIRNRECSPCYRPDFLTLVWCEVDCMNSAAVHDVNTVLKIDSCQCQASEQAHKFKGSSCICKDALQWYASWSYKWK